MRLIWTSEPSQVELTIPSGQLHCVSNSRQRTPLNTAKRSLDTNTLSVAQSVAHSFARSTCPLNLRLALLCQCTCEASVNVLDNRLKLNQLNLFTWQRPRQLYSYLFLSSRHRKVVAKREEETDVTHNVRILHIRATAPSIWYRSNILHPFSLLKHKLEFDDGQNSHLQRLWRIQRLEKWDNSRTNAERYLLDTLVVVSRGCAWRDSGKLA